MGDSRKYPYLYHGRLFGFPKERGGSRLWNSEGMGRYLRLEIRSHGGIPELGFLEKKVYSEFLENAIIVDFYGSY